MVQNKCCGKCKEIKIIDQYLVTKQGIASYCHDCRKTVKRESYQRNKESILAKQREFRQTNPDIVKEWKRKERINCRERINSSSNKWRANNPDKRKEIIKKSSKKCREQKRQYERTRRATDPDFKLRQNLRCRLKAAIKAQGMVKTNGTAILIGCSIQELRNYLESKFTDGMNWDNHGKWHIDHIKPLSSFNLIDIEQQLLAFHWSNMQPLWAIDNFLKSDFYPE